MPKKPEARRFAQCRNAATANGNGQTTGIQRRGKLTWTGSRHVMTSLNTTHREPTVPPCKLNSLMSHHTHKRLACCVCCVGCVILAGAEACNIRSHDTELKLSRKHRVTTHTSREEGRGAHNQTTVRPGQSDAHQGIVPPGRPITTPTSPGRKLPTTGQRPRREEEDFFFLSWGLRRDAKNGSCRYFGYQAEGGWSTE